MTASPGRGYEAEKREHCAVGQRLGDRQKLLQITFQLTPAELLHLFGKQLQHSERARRRFGQPTHGQEVDGDVDKQQQQKGVTLIGRFNAGEAMACRMSEKIDPLLEGTKHRDDGYAKGGVMYTESLRLAEHQKKKSTPLSDNGDE